MNVQLNDILKDGMTRDIGQNLGLYEEPIANGMLFPGM